MIEVFSAFLTPVIAIITTFIAVKQWRLEKRQWRLACYDKRFETYRIVAEFISSNSRAAGTQADQEKFLQTASRNSFLFDPTIQAYIEELYTKSIDKSDLARTIEDSQNASQASFRGELSKKITESSRWFQAQFEVARKHFGEYLKIVER